MAIEYSSKMVVLYLGGITYSVAQDIIFRLGLLNCTYTNHVRFTWLSQAFFRNPFERIISRIVGYGLAMPTFLCCHMLSANPHTLYKLAIYPRCFSKCLDMACPLLVSIFVRASSSHKHTKCSSNNATNLANVSSKTQTHFHRPSDLTATNANVHFHVHSAMRLLETDGYRVELVLHTSHLSDRR